jgi:hypothetical protein
MPSSFSVLAAGLLFSELSSRRSDRLNLMLRRLIPVAEIDRRLAEIDHIPANSPAPAEATVCEGIRPYSHQKP